MIKKSPSPCQNNHTNGEWIEPLVSIKRSVLLYAYHVGVLYAVFLCSVINDSLRKSQQKHLQSV